jgi:hypothetical protein
MNKTYRSPRFTIAMALDRALDCEIPPRRRLGARDAGTHEGAVKAAQTRKARGMKKSGSESFTEHQKAAHSHLLDRGYVHRGQNEESGEHEYRHPTKKTTVKVHPNGNFSERRRVPSLGSWTFHSRKEDLKNMFP